LGFICFPFDFTDLQVHKPASADLINSQFIRNWREIDPDFLPGLFDAGARVFLSTGARRARKRFFSSVLSARTGAECASVHTVGRAFEPKFSL
jgi:hypothetical protein